MNTSSAVDRSMLGGCERGIAHVIFTGLSPLLTTLFADARMLKRKPSSGTNSFHLFSLNM